jgi:hypothetical protein
MNVRRGVKRLAIIGFVMWSLPGAYRVSSQIWRSRTEYAKRLAEYEQESESRRGIVNEALAACRSLVDPSKKLGCELGATMMFGMAPQYPGDRAAWIAFAWWMAIYPIACFILWLLAEAASWIIAGFRPQAVNTTQKAVIWVGTALIVAMGLYPPWVRIGSYDPVGGEDALVQTREYTYGWLFAPPRAAGTASRKSSGKVVDLLWDELHWNTRLDALRLIAQWATVCFAVGGVIWALRIDGQSHASRSRTTQE